MLPNEPDRKFYNTGYKNGESYITALLNQKVIGKDQNHTPENFYFTIMCPKKQKYKCGKREKLVYTIILI